MLRSLVLNKPRLYAVLAVLVLAALGYFGVKAYGSARYNDGVKDSEARAKEVAMQKYITEIDRMITLTETLQDEILELRNAGVEIRTEYIKVRDTAPMPDGCRAGPDRMSIFSSALRAASAKP